MSNITETEVWLQAYTATLTGFYSQYSYGSEDIASSAAFHAADRAVIDFETRFPKFRFHSEENKT